MIHKEGEIVIVNKSYFQKSILKIYFVLWCNSIYAWCFFFSVCRKKIAICINFIIFSKKTCFCRICWTTSPVIILHLLRFIYLFQLRHWRRTRISINPIPPITFEFTYKYLVILMFTQITRAVYIIHYRVNIAWMKWNDFWHTFIVFSRVLVEMVTEAWRRRLHVRMLLYSYPRRKMLIALFNKVKSWVPFTQNCRL